MKVSGTNNISGINVGNSIAVDSCIGTIIIDVSDYSSILILRVIHINLFLPVMPLNGATVLIISFRIEFQKIFEGEILVTTQPTILLQTFCEFSAHSKIIFKSVTNPDDTSQRGHQAWICDCCSLWCWCYCVHCTVRNIYVWKWKCVCAYVRKRSRIVLPIPV